MGDIRFHRDKAVVTLRGSVDGEAVDRLVRALRSAHEDYFYDRIEISVRSTGGEIDALMEVLRETHRLRERGVTVDTVVRGMAGCGSACVAFLGDHRRADAGSTLYLHGARLGDQANLTALQSVVAGQYLAVWDGNVIEALAERALRTTPPTGGDADGIDGLDWRAVARVVSAEPPRTTGPTATQRRKLHASLRRTMRGFVSTGDREGLARLYAGLFERDEQIGAELARELLLLDGVGDEPEAPPESAGEPCLHVPEWRPLWPAGRVPTRLLCRHTLILGETGSGKTMSGVRPLLDALLAPGLPDGTVGCVLVVDPKRELWDVVRDRGARRIDIGGAGGPAVNLMSGDAWDVTADVAAGRYLAAAERVLVRSASLAPLSPANALAGRPSGGYSQYWQTDGARMALTATALTMALLEEGKALFAGGEAAPLKDVSGRRADRAAQVRRARRPADAAPRTVRRGAAGDHGLVGRRRGPRGRGRAAAAGGDPARLGDVPRGRGGERDPRGAAGVARRAARRRRGAARGPESTGVAPLRAHGRELRPDAAAGRPAMPGARPAGARRRRVEALVRAAGHRHGDGGALPRAELDGGTRRGAGRRRTGGRGQGG